MVIVQLNGGLGNQMFQYAAGRAIACRSGAPLGLDNSILQRSYSRPYRLNRFNISARLVSAQEVNEMVGEHNPGFRLWFHTIWRYTVLRRPSPIFREKGPRYDPKITQVRPPLYLVGYWQSEKYFKDIEPVIRSEFVILDPPDAQNAFLLAQIEDKESVSVHIRRGDYVTDPRISRVHGACSLDYYHAAIQLIEKRLNNPHFFVFSDDIDWAEHNLRLGSPGVYVKSNGPERDVEDFRLLMGCKHHIIANSSFSWWGAWLCSHPGKIVIAPAKWFRDPALSSRDIIPASWLQL
jgi:hypothetical protein